MRTILLYTPEEGLRRDVPLSALAAALSNPQALLWLDFENEPDPAAEPLLTGIFRFHPLAVDDALAETHTPKVDD